MLTVAVLGAVEVLRDGVRAPVPAGLTTELLTRLALDPGRPIRVERLVDDLWPDGTATRRNTLQAKVSQLRRALGDPSALTGGPAGYSLMVDPQQVDAVQVLQLADEASDLLAQGHAAAAAATCRTALELFGPEILPAAATAEWAQPHRVRLEETRLRLNEDELAARLALGATAEVTGELEALVSEHPLRERLWALLITALYRAGRQADALAAYRRVSRLLNDELGVEPGAELMSLQRQVLTHDQALLPVPRAPTDERRPGNVPALTDPLVGRGAELGALRARIAASRLVTLVGSAGVGKTRLAVEVARGIAFPDGAWLVRLEGVRSAEELPWALAEAVPGVDGGGPDMAAGLRGADLLLVLDNCEHLLDPVAALVAHLLEGTRRVRVLATSQRPLGLPGEQVLPLAPLLEADAVALFAQRAEQRRPDFAVTAENAATVAHLCRTLDCLPLAIELAAARARILTLDEIAARLEDRFTLLTDPTSTGSARRRSLAAALSWSYDQLFPDDQRGLWALAQFPAGATLSAVEHVLSALDVPPAAAMDVVERLVDRSLVSVDISSGSTRYRLLDSVRAFAAARAAEAGQTGRGADAVVEWVGAMADVVDAHVRGPAQPAQVALTAAERATVDAALEHARTTDPVAGLRIAVALGWAWVLLDDGAAVARLRAARLATVEAPRHLEVTGLLLEGWFEAMSGDLRAARTALDEAIALAGDDSSLIDLVRWYGAFVLTQEGRFPEALADLRLCKEAFAARGATWWHGGAHLLSAFAYLALGDVAAGQTACEEAIAVLTPLGDAWALLHAQAALGRVAQAEHRFADAARHHGSAADAADRLGFVGAAALHRSHLGQAQHGDGDPAAAGTLRRAISVAEVAGDLRLLAGARVALAEVLREAGDRAAARDLLVAATRWYADSGAGEGAAHAAGALTVLRAEDGDPDAVGRLPEILTAARKSGDSDVERRARAALASVPIGVHQATAGGPTDRWGRPDPARPDMNRARRPSSGR